MSRVGKYPVEIPAGVQVAVAMGKLTVKGKLGELSLALSDNIDAVVEGGKLSVNPRGNSNPARMMWGTTRALVANMVKGVLAYPSETPFTMLATRARRGPWLEPGDQSRVLA
jgi:large subunit ribosomal protein L6